MVILGYQDFMLPCFSECDKAMRTPPCEPYPWDGMANVRPYSRFATTVVEGVY